MSDSKTIPEQAFSLLQDYISECKEARKLLRGLAEKSLSCHIAEMESVSSDILFSDVRDLESMKSVANIMDIIYEEGFAEFVRSEVA
jgi:hypothetical protein